MIRKQDQEFYLYAALFALAGIGVVLLFAVLGNREVGDLLGQWKLCAYAVRGVDPYPYIGASLSDVPQSVKDLGTLPGGFNASPWGLAVGNIYYFGFLDFAHVEACFLALCAVMWVCTVMCVYIKAREIMPDKRFVYLAVIVAAGSADFFITMHQKNVSGLIGCMLILAWVFCDDHPILTGILLGIAMTKPQCAGLVCLAFLLEKRFLPLVIGGLIDAAGWIYASVITGTGMIDLLMEFLAQGHKVVSGASWASRFYVGICTVFFDDFNNGLKFSMLAGIIFTAVFWYIYRRSSAPKYFSLCFACIAQTFWSYSSSSDHYVLLLPSIACLYIMMNSEQLSRRIFWVCTVFCLSWSEIFRSKKLWELVVGSECVFPTIRALKTTYYTLLILLAVVMYKRLAEIGRKQEL